MYKKGFISVIVPVYNVEKYLRQCLDSIINQTYRDLDIILVDDGSKDNSGAICDEYAEKDSRIRVIHKENGGLSSARNAGLDLIDKNGGGEFISFIDSDDFFALDIYEKCINKFVIFPETDIVVFSFINEPQNYYIKKEIIYDNFDNISKEQILYLYESLKISGSVCEKIFKYDKVKSLRFPIGKVYEDVVYSFWAIYNSNKITTMSDIGYYYRVDNINSITHIMQPNILDLYYNIEDIRQHFIDCNDEEYIRSVNTLLIYQLRARVGEIHKMTIYSDYLQILKRTRKYPIRKNSIFSYIRFRLFSYMPNLFLILADITWVIKNKILTKKARENNSYV